jgi:multidrug efflux pump subunit AcrB
MDRFKQQVAMPASIVTEWAGDAAAFQKSQASQIVLLVSALLVIYVLLGVLYESYIHPITILAGIPSAAIGALLTLRLFGLDLSITPYMHSCRCRRGSTSTATRAAAPGTPSSSDEVHG